MTATQARTDARPTATTTVVTRIRDRAAATPTDVALRSKDFGLWQETSWAEYYASYTTPEWQTAPHDELWRRAAG